MPTVDLKKRKIALKKRTSASNKGEFNQMRRWFPDRVTILAQGDSWFAYPPKWIIKGRKPSNLIAHISRWTKGKANFYCMASNGDEAVDMVSGKQKHALVDLLRWHEKKNRKPVDLLLFSGGGNDVVGKNDFERFLKKYEPGFSAAKCVRVKRLERKTKQIGLSIEELLDIRDHYSPETIVLTHTYDYPFPSLRGGKFLGGLIKTKAWMKRFMDKNKIPDTPQNPIQAEIIKIFMNSLGDQFVRIAQEREGFIAVETRNTLKNKKEWLNEIHPTSEGFEKIAQKIYRKMKAEFPALR